MILYIQVIALYAGLFLVYDINGIIWLLMAFYQMNLCIKLCLKSMRES